MSVHAPDPIRNPMVALCQHLRDNPIAYRQPKRPQAQEPMTDLRRLHVYELTNGTMRITQRQRRRMYQKRSKRLDFQRGTRPADLAKARVA